MALALRLIREGLPEFTAAQRRQIARSAESSKLVDEMEQCRKPAPHRGVDFGCFLTTFLPQEHAALTQCWTTRRAREPQIDCLEQIYHTCDRIHNVWSRYLLTATEHQPFEH